MIIFVLIVLFTCIMLALGNEGKTKETNINTDWIRPKDPHKLEPQQARKIQKFITNKGIRHYAVDSNGQPLFKVDGISFL